MMANRILFVITIIIPLILGEKALEFVFMGFDMPPFLQGLVDAAMDLDQALKENEDFFEQWVSQMAAEGQPDSFRRGRVEQRPMVELGPGVFKTEIVTYPPHYLQDRIKYLLMVKEKKGKTKA